MTGQALHAAVDLLTKGLPRDGSDMFGRHAGSFFEVGRRLALQAADMPFSDGARLVMIQSRSYPEIARDALILAFLAELQDARARVPA